MVNHPDAAASRATISGVSTSFEAGDQIGFFAIERAFIMDDEGDLIENDREVYYNIPLTFDGNEWKPSDNVKLFHSSNFTYYAYYPYQEDLNGWTNDGEEAPEDFFEYITNFWEPKLDQSTLEDYLASDLMVGKGTDNSETASVAFTLDHQMGLVRMDYNDGPNYIEDLSDIEAKHTAPDADGVRIAELDEMTYRRKLWSHRPITDFWRVGKGTAKKLARYGMFTMGDVARYSLKDEDLLYKLFGVNAELLIDHAWGWEPCTIDYIKAYKPENRSFSAGQVLQCPYEFEKARIVVLEMADAAALDLVEKRLAADQMVLTVVYDNENLTNPAIREKYKGPVKKDWYGRMAPKPEKDPGKRPSPVRTGGRWKRSGELQRE